MANKFYYPSTRKITLGGRLKIEVLPPNLRVATDYMLTVTQAFNSNVNPGIIYLKSNIDVFASAETKLTFSGITIQVAEESEIPTTLGGVAVPIIDQPANITIPINSSTTSKVPTLVHGCKSFNCTNEIQTIDTTNVSHGIEKEEKQTFNSKKISLEIIEIYGDNGGQFLLDMCENPIYRNSELYFDYSYPDGSYKRGVALITSFSSTTNLQSLKTFRIEARVQPGTYSYFNP